MNIQRTSLVTQLSDALRARLSSGEEGWTVGNRIPPEHRLADELGVGRSSIREAVRVLANEGWLETRQGAGTFVRRNAVAPGTLLTHLRRAQIAEVFEARHGLEVEAARLAARRRTTADLAQIDACLRRRLDNGASPRNHTFVDADIDFHIAIVEASHNAVLVNLFDSFVDVLKDSLLELTDHDLVSDEAAAAHIALADAVRAGDPEAAGAAARAQFEPTERSLRDSVLP